MDELHIYNNSINRDFTDNAKFYQLQFLQEPVFYFSCDSDIIYPPDYIERTKELIDFHKCIISYHGRKLIAPINSYYKGHTVYDFRTKQENDYYVDIVGTGVCGFRTDYFNPTEIYKSEYKRMSDIVFSLEAKRQGKQLICASHESNWIRQQYVESSIMKSTIGKNQEIHCNLAKQILSFGE